MHYGYIGIPVAESSVWTHSDEQKKDNTFLNSRAHSPTRTNFPWELTRVEWIQGITILDITAHVAKTLTKI